MREGGLNRVINGFKICGICGDNKPVGEYYSHTAGTNYVQAYCKLCKNKVPKSQTPEAKRRRAATSRLWAYGVTQESFDTKFESQGRKCAICGTTDPSKSGWQTDHDHASNRFRGVLCNPCNLFIGLAKESVHTLMKAIMYLLEEK